MQLNEQKDVSEPHPISSAATQDSIFTSNTSPHMSLHNKQLNNTLEDLVHDSTSATKELVLNNMIVSSDHGTHLNSILEEG
jgi:DNA/RNA endonuclease G (NUC1)